MSGPFDRADDPDEVTLWAGRLRAWPAPPTVPDLDDDTVRSAREPIDDRTIVSAGREPDDATIRSTRPGVDDDTVQSPRRVLEDDTIVSAAGLRVPDADTPDDDLTTTSPRRRPVTAPEPLAVDEATRLHPLAPPTAEAADLDDETLRRPAPAPGPDAGVLDEVTRRRPAAVPEITLDEITRRRDPATLAGEVLDDETRVRARSAPEIDDDTASGARRRAVRASARSTESGDEVPGAVRAAHIPLAGEQQSYAARTHEPVRVRRRVPVSAPAVRRDAVAVRVRSGRRGALRALILAGVFVVLVGVVVATALVLLG